MLNFIVSLRNQLYIRWHILSMTKLLSIIFCLVSLTFSNVDAQKEPVHKVTSAPFQGTKEFCSFLKPVKYKVTISGNKVAIVYLYKEYKNIVKGEFRYGKLYTNDKNENKANAGKVYRLTDTYISVNNLEGGDYVEYNLSK